jgi:predicted phage baseplate assembly protein
VSGDLTARRPSNRPGLDEIAYRIGRQPEFLARMLAAIASETVTDQATGATARPLAGLSTRALDEPTIALMDAWASALEVLTFYQERIANEGYIRTAVERVSAVELVRAIGYELNPGVAASAYLAFTVEDADDPFRSVDVPDGTQIMSVPQESGERPQTFETVETIQARAEWNAIPARTERPQNLALFYNADDAADARNGTLFLLDVDDSFEFPDPAEDAVDAADLVSIDLTGDGDYEPFTNFLPLAAGLDLETTLTGLEEDAALNPDIVPIVRGLAVDYMHLRGVGLSLDPGDRLLLVGRREVEGGDAEMKVVAVRVDAASEDSDYGMTRVDFTPITDSAPRPRRRLTLTPRVATLPAGAVLATPLAFNAANVGKLVVGQTWSGAALTAFVKTQAWPREKLMQLLRKESDVTTASVGEVAAGVYVLRQKAGFFGNSAPLWSSLASGADQRGTDPYTAPWDKEGSTPAPRSIWVTSQGSAREDAHVLLEREVSEVAPGGLVLFEMPSGKTRSFLVAAAATQSVTDFAQSGKATGLSLREPNDTEFDPFGDGTADLALFTFRKTTAWVGSEALELAGLPIEDDLAAGATEVMLDNLYLDLEPGRAVSVSGERADAPGVEEAETIILEDVTHTGGFTRLTLAAGTEYSYTLPTVRVNANVALATHGEAIEETLGDGDATQPNQAFALSKTPLTFVSAATETGSATTLAVRVNGVEWTEYASLYDAGPEDDAYAVRIDDDGTTRVVFGDGVHGRRLPTGSLNVTASYRSGMGVEGDVSEETLIQLKKRPLGVRSVTNPSAATGAASAESLDDARGRGPQSVRTLGRIVSLTDYEDFARAFAGVGKARASLLTSGSTRVVHVTIAPATDGAFSSDSETLVNLREAMESLRDPLYTMAVSPHEARLFRLSATVFYDASYIGDTVESAVRTELETRFGYGARSLAQPVSAAEVMAAIQGVDGVSHVDLDVLEIYSEDDTDASDASLASLLAAEPARKGASADEAAYVGDELLTLLAAGIELTMTEAADE